MSDTAAMVNGLQRTTNLKDQGTRHFRRGEFAESRARYSDAIDTITNRDDNNEDKDLDELLWTLLNNRAAVNLKLRCFAAALMDSRRALSSAGPGWSASLRNKAALREADALAGLSLWDDAHEAFRGLVRSGNRDGGSTEATALFRGRIERLLSEESLLPHILLRPEEDLVEELSGAPEGATILLLPGTYYGPVVISKSVRIIATSEGVKLTAVEGIATVQVSCERGGTVLLQGLSVVRDCTPAWAASREDSDAHALFVTCGHVTADKCQFVSAEGAGVSAKNVASRLFLQSSLACMSNGAGLLVANGAKAYARGLTTSKNDVSGVEVRERGELVMEGCEFASNLKQGLFMWCGAARASLTKCHFEDHVHESSVFIDDGEAEMNECRASKGVWGFMVSGGTATLRNCEACGCKAEGVLVQERGSARVIGCKSHCNNSSGILIGFDVTRRVVVKGNYVYYNLGTGIVNRVPNPVNVDICANTEEENMLAYSSPGAFAAFTRKWNQMIKERTEQVRATPGSKQWNAFATNEWLRNASTNGIKIPTKVFQCWECDTQLECTGKLLQCRECRIAMYCSEECRTVHWNKKGGHEGKCKTFIAYEAYGSGKDVREFTTTKHSEFTMIDLGIDQGEPEAMLQKAMIHAEMRNFSAAAPLVRRAAELGDVEGMLQYGYFHEFGLGVRADDGHAEKWYRKAAAKEGSAKGYAFLGNLYRTKDGPGAAAQAKEWWAKAKCKGFDGTFPAEYPCGLSPKECRMLRRNPASYYLKMINQKQTPNTVQDRRGELSAAVELLSNRLMRDKDTPILPTLELDNSAIVAKMMRRQEIERAATLPGMMECANYARACSETALYRATLDYSPTLTDSSLLHISNALLADEKAIVFLPEDRSLLLNHTKNLRNSGRAAPETLRAALLIEGMFSGPLDGLQFLIKLENEISSLAPSEIESRDIARICELIGSSYGFCQRWSQHQKWFERSLKIDPGSYQAHFALAGVYRTEGDTGKAIKLYKMFLDNCPRDARKSVDANYAIAACLLGGNTHAQKKDSPSIALEILAQGKDYFRSGQEQEAELDKFWGVSTTNDKESVQMLLALHST